MEFVGYRAADWITSIDTIFGIHGYNNNEGVSIFVEK